MLKQKTITINGKEITISEARKRMNQLAKGFAIGAFDKDQHAKHWKKFEEIRDELRKINGY